MFKLVIKDQELQDEVRRVQGIPWRTMLEAFGAWMLASVAENFWAEGRPEKWQELKLATQIARWTRGNRERKRKRKWGKGVVWERFVGGMKILFDSGRLAGSVGFAATDSQVEIGTNLIYAATQNFGRGKIPARPYLLFQEDDVSKFEELIMRYLSGVEGRTMVWPGGVAE